MNTKRLLEVTRWNLISNKREIRRTFTGLITAYCIIIAAFNVGKWMDHSVHYYDIVNSTQFIIAGTGFAMLLWASRVCFNMSTKTTFINYAMLPATNLEKYVSNILYQTLCRLAVVVAAFLIADALQAIVSQVLAGDAYSITAYFIDWHNSYNLSDHIGAIIALFFVHSTFVLGGTLFRHHQFLFTCLTWLVVPFLLSTVFAGAGAAALYYLQQNGYDISFTPWFSDDTYETLGGAALVGIICFNYWLSYRLFRRSQVINNKFFN